MEIQVQKSPSSIGKLGDYIGEIFFKMSVVENNEGLDCFKSFSKISFRHCAMYQRAHSSHG